MRWRGPRLVRGRRGRRAGRPAPRTARRGRTPARPAGFPAPPASRSHLRMMPVSNGKSILTVPAVCPQGSAGIHFRFFRHPHFIHRRWLVIRISRRLSTGLCTLYPQMPWITPELQPRALAELVRAERDEVAAPPTPVIATAPYQRRASSDPPFSVISWRAAASAVRLRATRSVRSVFLARPNAITACQSLKM